MLRRYVEQILKVYNYVDAIMVVDVKGFIEYFVTYRPDINRLKEKDVLGKNILEVYPKLTEETSRLMRVIKTGKPINNEIQTMYSYNGQSIKAINSAMPIFDNDKVVGAVDVSRYVDAPFKRENIILELKEVKNVSSLFTVDDIITCSQQMKLIKERIEMVADTPSPVLIYGETGTGKELVAQSIHTSSSRRNKKFISQNCAAIPSNLLESILFGTVKGSYTGAENRPGLFEIANGGTLFLDEINSMELSAQSKLLKAVEEQQITRVGGTGPIPINVKIISAVNQPPIDCIRQGKIKEDLFYRLSVVQFNMPSLRERSSDLFYLVSYFINEYNKKMNRNILGIDEQVENIFRKYHWPGNVRELKNVIEGAFNIVESGFIQRRDLPEYMLNVVEYGENRGAGSIDIDFDTENFSLADAVGGFEKDIIEKALRESRNVAEAARKLKISKQSLSYKMNKYGVTL